MGADARSGKYLQLSTKYYLTTVFMDIHSLLLFVFPKLVRVKKIAGQVENNPKSLCLTTAEHRGKALNILQIYRNFRIST